MRSTISGLFALLVLTACIAEKPAPCYSSFCSMSRDELAAVDTSMLNSDEKLQFKQAKARQKQLVKFEKQRRKNIRHYYKYTEVDFNGPDRGFTAHATTPYEVGDPLFAGKGPLSDDYILFTHGNEMGTSHQLSITVMYDVSEEDGLGFVEEQRLWRGYEQAAFKDGEPADIELGTRSIGYCQPVKKLVGYDGDYHWMEKCQFMEGVDIPLSHNRIRRALELDLPIELYLTSPKGPRQHYIVPTTLLAAYIMRLHHETGLFADDVARIPALQRAGEMVASR